MRIDISLFVVTDRWTWVALNQIKGVIGFALCGLAGFLCLHRGCTLRSAFVSGLIGGSMAAIAYPLSIYLLAYGFLDWVQQYPFEYHSMLGSGMTDPHEFLLSDRGRATVS